MRRNAYGREMHIRAFRARGHASFSSFPEVHGGRKRPRERGTAAQNGGGKGREPRGRTSMERLQLRGAS